MSHRIRTTTFGLGFSLVLAVALSTPLPAVFDFSPAGDLPVTPAPNLVTTADLNGDGSTDLLVRTGLDLQWLAADGSGAFLPAQVVLSITAHDLAVGDLNGDAILDLVIGENPATVSIHFGTGAGGFVTGPTIATGMNFPSVECVDLDGDGNFDVITTRILASGDEVVSVYRGDGIGGFLPPTDATTGGSPRELLAADLNNDGDLDLVVGNYNISQFGGSFAVLYGNGSAGLSPAVVFGTAGPVTGLSVGALNADSFLDLAVLVFTPASFCGSHAHLFYADATGGYAIDTILTGVCGPHAVLPADYDGDGVIDLLTTDGGDLIAGANWVDVHRGVGDGTFLPAETFTISIASLEPPALIDYDLDGRLDFVTAGLGSALTLYHNDTIPTSPPFRRADANSSGAVEPIADAIFLLSYGFVGGDAPGCFSAADVDDDGAVNPIADAINLLNYGFIGGPQPPPPFPDCGIDPTPDPLGCLSYDGALCP